MAAGRSANPAYWQPVFEDALGRIAGRFARREPRPAARAFLSGLLSWPERKTCGSWAEQAGCQQSAPVAAVLRTAVWNAEQVITDVRGLLSTGSVIHRACRSRTRPDSSRGPHVGRGRRGSPRPG